MNEHIKYLATGPAKATKAGRSVYFRCGVVSRGSERISQHKDREEGRAWCVEEPPGGQ